MNFADLLAGVFSHNLFQQPFNPQAFAQINLLIGHFTARTAGRLVNHNRGIGQQKALALGAGTQQKRGGRGLYANADRLDVVFDVLHGVINGQGVVNTAAGTVYI